jgi:hypothetical protein
MTVHLMPLLLRSSEVRVEFDLSASDNLAAPAVPISLPVLSENEMKQQVLLQRLRVVRDEFDLRISDNSFIINIIICIE